VSEWVTEGVLRTDQTGEIEAKVLLSGVPQSLALPRSEGCKVPLESREGRRPGRGYWEVRMTSEANSLTPTLWNCFECDRQFLAEWGELCCSPDCKAAWQAKQALKKKPDLAGLLGLAKKKPEPVRIRRLS